MPAPVRSGGYQDLAWPRLSIPATYYFAHSHAANTTVNSLGNNTLRVGAWFVPQPVTIVRIGAEFTVAGEASSVLRLGIYSQILTPGGTFGDPGGGLVLDAGSISTGTGDAGTIATGGTPGAYEIVCNVNLVRGWYFIGGAVQGAPTTQPTIRGVSTGNMFDEFRLGASAPGASNVTVAYSIGGASGALPSVPGFGPGFAGNLPRVLVRTA